MKDAVLILVAWFAIALAFPCILMVSLMLWQQVREMWKEIKEEKDV